MESRLGINTLSSTNAGFVEVVEAFVVVVVVEVVVVVVVEDVVIVMISNCTFLSVISAEINI